MCVSLHCLYKDHFLVIVFLVSFLSVKMFRRKHHPNFMQILQQNLAIFDYYRVENAHSIDRDRTTDADTVEQRQKLTKTIY